MASHTVVTGAAGFVGGFVARWLASRGHEVTAISRRPGGEALPNLAWREADLRSPGSLPAHFDALIHCAAETPEHQKNSKERAAKDRSRYHPPQPRKHSKSD